MASIKKVNMGAVSNNALVIDSSAYFNETAKNVIDIEANITRFIIKMNVLFSIIPKVMILCSYSCIKIYDSVIYKSYWRSASFCLVF